MHLGPLNHKHRRESVEHYTPDWIVDIARKLMGGIELDPASSVAANVRIGAERICTADTPAPFDEPWIASSVFCNPPGAMYELNADGTPMLNERGKPKRAPPIAPQWGHTNPLAFWHKLVHEYAAGNIGEVFFVGFSLEMLQVFGNCAMNMIDAKLWPLAWPTVFPVERVRYLRADGSSGMSPPGASFITYLPRAWDGSDGPDPARQFDLLFAGLAWVVRQ